ncbi:Polyphenol oxidase [Vibrio stylophorae]|uniref:Purine nucleoside phosphorylase n=1 Tax=Vibrio stylophorae TaxID=659351 RepID=A0ABM8ZVH4_9VIBR|nr:peptidoglycan editing factor PgeF [Vibrio stylophorae]CAH0534304.1 Polyphenol oxidase [Vibrio stylophorae]
MEWIIPNWPAPAHIQACTTTRIGGISEGVFAGFNVGDHVGDNPTHVAQNRAQLAQRFAGPIHWLTQTHSTRVVNLDLGPANQADADASFSSQINQICAVMTADCLPVLFCDRLGTQVAAAHAGWRGLCDGVLEQTLSHFSQPIADILVWLGPAIGPKAFEVGAEVREQFIAQQAQAVSAFTAAQAINPHADSHKYFADIYQLARLRLQALGIDAESIYGGDYCTYTDAARFFSYRREGQTGRMVSCITIGTL